MKGWTILCAGIVAVVVGSFVPFSITPSPVRSAHSFSDALWHTVASFSLLSVCTQSRNAVRVHTWG